MYIMIETKKRSIILDLILGAVILLIAILFWPNEEKYTQSNKIDITKTQIKITTKRINIRKEASTDSEDIGDVYKDEIYTVLGHIEDEKYNWYKIETNQGIVGYIASDPSDEYVEVESGYVDRKAPIIKCDKDFLVFINDNTNYDDITCVDDHSTCTMSYEKEPEYITFYGVDEDNNKSSLKIKYYNVYNLYSEYYENNFKINTKTTKSKKDNTYTINTFYTINNMIANSNKANNYTPIINFYDSNMVELGNIYVIYNKDLLPTCINNNNFTLKEEYIGNDLLKGSTLCMSYTFNNQENRIKYVSFGFTSVENYNNVDNLLASSYSKTFILDN